MAKSILLIEDDVDIQKIYTDKLLLEGFEVIAASEGKEGLVNAREKNPDAILLDIMLPGGVNGFDILENLKKDEDLKQIPVLVLTNLDSEKEMALKIGAEDFLVKSETDLSEMVEKIKKLAG